MSLTTTQFIKDYRAAALTLFADQLENLSVRQQYAALAFVVKGYYATDWAKTKADYDARQQKQLYYFSIEFMPGQLLGSNLLNLGIKTVVEAGLHRLTLDPATLYAAEGDPGLGNGGLGRLASAFLDAMASVGMAGNGNGIRYQYGLFEQRFVDGYQVELPDDWLRDPYMWETRKENRAVIVKFGGQVELRPRRNGSLQAIYHNAEDVLAVPYDIAMVGYHTKRVNTLRLWAAEPVPGRAHNLAEKSRVTEITQILYPDDSNTTGRELRLRQEYFFVSAGVQSIITHFKRQHEDLHLLPQFVAIHINDTHPAMAVLELMRILLDEEQMTWDEAWAITVATLSYTNHTLMTEALESWPEPMFAGLLPRLYQVAQEVDRRFRATYTKRYGELLVNRAAPLGDGQLRMAYLAVIGSHAVNGVAKLHSELLKDSVLKDLYTLFPARFNNKTNGITPRRWVQLADQPLADLLDQTLGQDWRRDPRQLEQLRAKATTPQFLTALHAAKRQNKVALAAVIQATLGLTVNPDAIFDVQIKRLHAYKRQLLHVFGILEAYRALKAGEDRPARVHVFGAKAAPSYRYAKAVIKLINAVADLVNHDPDVAGRLQVAFLPNYGVTLAEHIIPAADISEQISLAGTEASGTSNMKLMATGALTLATLDGANIEMRAAAGPASMAMFGLTAEEVAQKQRDHSYNARAVYEADPVLHAVVDMLTDGSIPGIASEGPEIVTELLDYNDTYFVLADFQSYVTASRQLDQLWQAPAEWGKRVVENLAASGQFSADFTVQRYGREVWNVLPEHPVD
ncbi:glycogen/starch/alpha-glucan family phosphorylase [Lacticaseibacillus daqingensis]|uniref:glycogen/starch/alpha-glucan family phosphorylase n=1 Tax=Lacticaseibacillus daqingensis TaxID=2486014 RepID=UPI000F792099|nr:glycogen/starch/alpha-glucan family phosphorylase [Lacticaseibacillus daqingensis]